MDDPAEREQIERAKQDPSEFGLLYDRYIDRIYAYALRQTEDPDLAKDVASMTFEKALRSLRRYRWHGVSFGAWLYRIARNEIRIHFRKQHRIAPLPQNLSSGMDLEGNIQSDEQVDDLLNALGRLSIKDRDLLVLRYFEGLSSPEVAQVLGCSTQNVYVRLYRALNRLRRKLESQ